MIDSFDQPKHSGCGGYQERCKNYMQAGKSGIREVYGDVRKPQGHASSDTCLIQLWQIAGSGPIS